MTNSKPYQALARKWRPQRFDQIVGQAHVVQTLTHALSQNKLHHAYLFTGTHGIGKTTLARIFAKCLNCETGITATSCEKCTNCREINVGCFPDLFEIDAASRTKVEDTREFLENIPYAPTSGRFKVYLIDEVHMLSGHSFNALLKTLEEPPTHVKFLLATTDPQKLPATVLSRCLQFHLSKMTSEQIAHQLTVILTAEKISYEKDALHYLSTAASGSMRDALSLLDQCIAYGNGAVKTIEAQAMLGLSSRTDLFALLKAMDAGDANTALSLTAAWENQGVNFTRCLSELLTQLYRISIIQSVEQHAFKNDPELKICAQSFQHEAIQQYYQIALQGQRNLALAPTAQIGFEMMLMRMMLLKHEKEKIQPARMHTPTCVAVTPQQTQHWPTLLSQLNLKVHTLALAQHCAMRTLTSQQIELVLHKKYSALLNARQQQRIQEVLIQHMHHDIKLMIIVEEHQMETPADLVLQSQKANQAFAKKAIAADARIQRIVETFDATVIADSVESNKS